MKSLIDLPGKLGPELFNSKFYSFLMKYLGINSLDEFRDLTKNLSSDPVEGEKQIDQVIAFAIEYLEKRSDAYWSSYENAISLHIYIKTLGENGNQIFDPDKPISVEITLRNGTTKKLEVHPFKIDKLNQS